MLITNKEIRAGAFLLGMSVIGLSNSGCELLKPNKPESTILTNAPRFHPNEMIAVNTKTPAGFLEFAFRLGEGRTEGRASVTYSPETILTLPDGLREQAVVNLHDRYLDVIFGKEAPGITNIQFEVCEISTNSRLFGANASIQDKTPLTQVEMVWTGKSIGVFVKDQPTESWKPNQTLRLGNPVPFTQLGYKDYFKS